MTDLYKSLPYALAAYIVIGTVLTIYLGSILFRIAQAAKEIEHINSLSEENKVDVNE